MCIQEQEKTLNNFLESKVIKEREMSFPKEIVSNVKKVFSNYIVDNSNPKTKNLLFRNLRENRTLMKHPERNSEKIVSYRRNIQNNKSPIKTRLKEDIKCPEVKSIPYSFIINSNEKENILNIQNIDEKQFYSEMSKTQAIKFFDINKAVNLPMVLKEPIKPEFDFHTYKNKLDYPYSANSYKNEFIPTIENIRIVNNLNKDEALDYLFKETNFNKEKKKFYNIFKNDNVYDFKALKANSKSRLFSDVDNKRNNSAAKHIPKRICSAHSTHYNGIGKISKVNINENLSKNLNYEIKNYNLNEKANLINMNTENKLNLRNKPSKYIPLNILDYEEIKTEKNEVKKNNKNLQIYQLTADELQNIDLNLNNIMLSSNKYSNANVKEFNFRKTMKFQIEENNKLKVSFAAQKDDKITEDVVSLNDQVLKTSNNLLEADMLSEIRNRKGLDKNEDLINFYEENKYCSLLQDKNNLELNFINNKEIIFNDILEVNLNNKVNESNLSEVSLADKSCIEKSKDLVNININNSLNENKAEHLNESNFTKEKYLKDLKDLKSDYSNKKESYSKMKKNSKKKISADLDSCKFNHFNMDNGQDETFNLGKILKIFFKKISPLKLNSQQRKRQI